MSQWVKGRISLLTVCTIGARACMLSTISILKGTSDPRGLFRAQYFALEFSSRRCVFLLWRQVGPFQLPQRPSSLRSVDVVCFSWPATQSRKDLDMFGTLNRRQFYEQDPVQHWLCGDAEAKKKKKKEKIILLLKGTSRKPFKMSGLC